MGQIGQKARDLLGMFAFLVGGGLVFALLYYWSRLEETQRWLQEQQNGAHQASSLLASFAEMKIVFAHAYRAKLLAGVSVWFTTNFWSSTCLFFFSYYVVNERGWSAAQVGHTLTFGYILAFFGYAAAGPLLDFAGRRLTSSLFFAIGGLSTIVCFRAESSLVITVAYIIVLGMNAVWAISATITSEIFPTHIRAMANAVANNLLGRTGMVLAPALVGIVSTWLGSVGKAVALLALLNFACIPVILWLVKETKGKSLEEIE